MKKFLSFLWQTCIFFLLICFVVTCSFLLFFNGADIAADVVRDGAKVTFFNILLLSALFTAIDRIRRKLTVERPVKRILEATRRVTHGDFTARIQPVQIPGAMNEFNQITEDFNTMAQELSGIETLRTDFFSNVSHELKTPLSIIQSYATMLQMPDLPPEKRREYAAAISQAALRFSEMIINILKLNRLEHQQIFPVAQPFNLSEQLCQCLLQFENKWESKDIEIATDIKDDVEITADAQLLSLVWNNLFSNAMKFTPPKGRVTVTLTADRSHATVTVTDTGCGLNAETGQHIFDKFYQGDTSHATQGNGLGLALVKRVIDITDAEIAVQSKVGKGSSFIVKLRKAANGEG